MKALIATIVTGGPVIPCCTKIRVLLEMIKFKHTVFALPFALMGAFLAGRGVPAPAVFLWVIVAMAGARTCAMGFNRIADRHFDALNPRTRERALPAGQVSLVESWMHGHCRRGPVLFRLLHAQQAGPCDYAPCPGPDPALFPDQAVYLAVSRGARRGPGLFAAGRLGGGQRLICRAFPGSCPWGCCSGWPVSTSSMPAWMPISTGRQACFPCPPVWAGAGPFIWRCCFMSWPLSCLRQRDMSAGLNLFYYVGIVLTGAALFYQHLVVSPGTCHASSFPFFQ